MINAKKTDFKLVIIGDCFVGKTTLLKKYVGKNDIGRSPFETYEINRYGEKIVLEIHDTNGQERYRSLTYSFYRGTHGCLLCFDLTKSASFDGLHNWIDDVEECVRENIPKLLVGLYRVNKHDSEISPKITKHKIDMFCELHGLHYIEVNLNDGKNIVQCFETLTDLMICEKSKRTREMYVDKDIVHLPRYRQEKKDDGCYC